MATETGPDLTAARDAVEALMDDTCTVTTGTDLDDAVLDPDTGKLVTAAGSAVYTGRCKVRPQSEARPLVVVEGSLHSTARFYVGSLPLSAPEVPVGATWTMTSSRRDPDLVGATFIVREVQYSTFAIQRKVVLELRERA